MIQTSYFVIIIFAIVFLRCYQSIPSNETVGLSHRNGKFFGVGLVRFENGICTIGGNLQGTCYTRRQCNDVGGVRSGECASGIGVCCVVQITCGGTTSNNNTYFVSPNFPNLYTGGSTCSVTIQKCNSDICQIRIDFLTFTLAQPNDQGICNTDAFYVIGGASNVPVICGENSGQHIYVDFNGDSDIQLVLNTNGAVSTSRSWNLKISQIGCDCPTKAPTGCLMYYTNLTGTVRSFNYGTTISQTGTRQLANQNYGVCVEMQPGYCSIRWSQASGDSASFSVSNNTFTAVGDGTLGTPAAAGTVCNTDFVVIPNPTPMAPTGDRFCGNGFVTKTSSSKPFVLTVVTDGNEIGNGTAAAPQDLGNRGFALMYAQQQCAGAIIG